MKPRETRQKVLIGARMRLDGGFCDVRIRDISSKGLLLEAELAPKRGSYLEIYRGRHVIVARVVWSNAKRFGVLAQDRMHIDTIVNEPDESGPRKIDPATQLPVERRASPRPSAQEIAQRATRNRYMSAAMQFGLIVMFGASAAVVLFGFVGHSFSEPLAIVLEKMSGD